MSIKARKIEFRAWNVHYEKMYNWGNVGKGVFDNDDYVIMQFTGLTDKNGVKIFEGDVVKVPTEWNSLIGVVEYNDYLASFNAWLQNRKEGCFLITDEDIEVIGNIFENPELIGAQNAKTTS